MARQDKVFTPSGWEITQNKRTSRKVRSRSSSFTHNCSRRFEVRCLQLMSLHVSKCFINGPEAAAPFEKGTGIDRTARQKHMSFESINQKILQYWKQSAPTALEQPACDVKALIDLVQNEQQTTRDRITSEIKDLKGDMFERRHASRVLDSLFFPNIYTRHEEISDAHASTFEWIFEPELGTGSCKWDSFTSWPQGDRKMYWINGKPGSGKSTLLRYMFQHEKTEALLRPPTGNRLLVGAAFFLWKASADPLQKGICGLLRALLYQLILSCPSMAVEVVSDKDNGIPAWTLRRLKEALTNLIFSHDHSYSFCFFIDGLDELEGHYAELTEYLEELSRADNLRICVSSRPYSAFRIAFKKYPQLMVQDLTTKDISTYINDKLVSTLIDVESNVLEPRDLSGFKEILLQKAEGVFMWVRIALHSLIQGLVNEDSEEELRQRLLELPPELERLYHHMFAQIEDRYKMHALKNFDLVRIAQGPLSILTMSLADPNNLITHWPNEPRTELDLVKFCKSMEKKIYIYCAAFLEVGYRNNLADPESTEYARDFPNLHHSKSRFELAKYDSSDYVVRFSHETAKEFLLQHMSIFANSWKPCTALAQAHIRRMKYLPWIEDMIFESCLDGPHMIFRYIENAGRSNEGVREQLLAELVRVANEAIAGAKCKAGLEIQYSSWIDACGRLGSRRYSGVARDIEGIIAHWGLPNHIDDILKRGFRQKDYLLQCALEVIDVSEEDLFRQQSMSVKERLSFIRRLLANGANPNAALLPQTRYDQKSRRVDLEELPRLWHLYQSSTLRSTVSETVWSRLLGQAFLHLCHTSCDFINTSGDFIQIFLDHRASLNVESIAMPLGQALDVALEVKDHHIYRICPMVRLSLLTILKIWRRAIAREESRLTCRERRNQSLVEDKVYKERHRQNSAIILDIINHLETQGARDTFSYQYVKCFSYPLPGNDIFAAQAISIITFDASRVMTEMGVEPILDMYRRFNPRLFQNHDKSVTHETWVRVSPLNEQYLQEICRQFERNVGNELSTTADRMHFFWSCPCEPEECTIYGGVACNQHMDINEPPTGISSCSHQDIDGMTKCVHRRLTNRGRS